MVLINGIIKLLDFISFIALNSWRKKRIITSTIVIIGRVLANFSVPLIIMP
ncbi:MAG: hypothetical protein PWQ58_453, partial [Archaeoglobaceae archaeon]|nr:hypothetical protein [Archaeoglobaceae archaeon]